MPNEIETINLESIDTILRNLKTDADFYNRPGNEIFERFDRDE